MHLPRRCERGLVQNVKASITAIGLLAAGEVALQSCSFNSGFGKLLCSTRCWRESLNAVTIGLGCLTNDREGRRFSNTCSTVKCYELLARIEDFMNSATLDRIYLRVII